VGDPARQPHEDSRGGTAKLLPLVRPAPGEVRATGVTSAPTAILPPWLRAELPRVLAPLPAPTVPAEARPAAAQWVTWREHEPGAALPPLRLRLVWDTLAGHLTPDLVGWRFQHGVRPRDTPRAGSWLNLAASGQRILVGRALAGAHPPDPEELITWLEETVAGWHAAPTPCGWDGKRRERRERARPRRLGGSGAALADLQLFAA
jgi:hypothetical protein